jgi:hypothetical protein
MGTSHRNNQRLNISPGERKALGALAEFPLLQAIQGRRSRRFPIGGQIPAGPLAWKSRRDPQPLSELERALVLSTVTGVTGWHFMISHHPGYAPALPNYSGSPSGRTFPSAAGFHTSQFFFTDDTGIYYLPTRDAPPDVPVIGGRVDIDDWLAATITRYQQLSNQRLFLPREEPYLEGHNTWVANVAGSLVVIPVADLAQHLLANLSFFAQNGYPIHDDINGRTLPGIQAFRHLRHFDEPFPLSFVEQYTLAEASAELMTATYNGHLLLGAMGLGGWSFDGMDRLSVLGASENPEVPGLGFSFQTDDRWSLPNPTGLPGVFESFCRPHFPDLGAAVRAYVDRKFGPGGPFHPDTPGPWTESATVRASAAPHDEAFIELLTLEASYIDNTFGKFPGTVPTVQIMNYLQAQHLDTEYYDMKFSPGAYLPTHAEHQSVWHG